jgi:hypothetical protein
MDAAPSESPVPAAAAPRRPRIRLTAALGGIAAVAVAVGFFQDWVTVEEDTARKYREAQRERALSEFEPSPTTEDWKALADHLVEHGAIGGLDVFHWARTARREARLLREDADRARARADAVAAPAPPYGERALLVLAVLLAFVPVGGIFIAFYFLLHGLRRAKTPVLVLAMWVGAVAVAFPAGYRRIAEGVLDAETDPTTGLSVLLVGGFALFLAGVFGVKAENWWRVFLGFLVVGALAGSLGYAYLQWGTV